VRSFERAREVHDRAQQILAAAVPAADEKDRRP